MAAATLWIAPELAWAQWIPLPPMPPAPSGPVDPWAPPPEEPPPPEPASPPAPVEPPPVELPPVESPPVEPAPVEPVSPTPLDPDEVPDGDEAPQASSAASRYPLSLPARPLLLPSGSANVAMMLELTRFARPEISAVLATLRLGGALTVGRTELGATLALGLGSSQDGPREQQLRFSRLQRVVGSVRQGVAEDTVVEADLWLTEVGTDHAGGGAELSLLHKAHLSESSALLLGTGLALRRDVVDRMGGGLRDADALSVYGSVAVEARLATHASAYAGISAAQLEPLDAMDISYRYYSSRLALVVTGEIVDVWFNWNVYSSGAYDTAALSVVFDVRSLP